MSEQTAIVPKAKQQTGLEHIKSVMLSPATKERFSEMMGADAIYYLNQVMIVVANSDKLQECAPSSIMISAMRAASLKLSVDPAQGQAWIIPYAGQATFQLGYRGVYELAMRTNLYRFINVPQVYEGEEVVEDRMTGMHSIQGKRTGDKIIGWMLYFEMFNGFKKTYYMTVEEIDAHAARYSASYKKDPKSKWNDKHERSKMERKTVLVNGLRKWGRFNPGDQEIINQIESEQGWVNRDGEVDAEFTDVTPEPDKPKQTAEEIVAELTGEKVEKKADQPPATPAEQGQEPANWPGAILATLAKEYGITTSQAKNMLALSNLRKDCQPDKVWEWVVAYKALRAEVEVIENGIETNKYTPQEAAAIVNNG